MARLAFAVAVVAAMGISTGVGAAQAPSPSDAARLPQIIAGVQVGPVRLGLRADEGVRAALAFEKATGCHIDLLTANGKVSAAGSEFGGCLEVFVPQGIRRVVSRVGFFQQPDGPFVGGPASAFIATFGEYRVSRLGARQSALTWPQGMIAHVAGTSFWEGMVTYVAVVTPGYKSIPAIGHFR